MKFYVGNTLHWIPLGSIDSPVVTSSNSLVIAVIVTITVIVIIAYSKTHSKQPWEGWIKNLQYITATPSCKNWLKGSGLLCKSVFEENSSNAWYQVVVSQTLVHVPFSVLDWRVKGCSPSTYVFHKQFLKTAPLGADHLTFEGGRGDGTFEKKSSCKAFTVKKKHWPAPPPSPQESNSPPLGAYSHWKRKRRRE